MAFGSTSATSGSVRPGGHNTFMAPSTPVQPALSYAPNYLSTPYTPSISKTILQKYIEQTPEVLELSNYDVPMTPVSPTARCVYPVHQCVYTISYQLKAFSYTHSRYI